MRHLPLWLELRRWRRAGSTAQLWWRDDDAAGGSAALDRLLQASRTAGAPLTVAVVPAGDMAGLRERLAGAALVSVAQHGVDHQNRRLGPSAGEFPYDWSEAQVKAALRQGWAQVRDLPRAEAVFAPPWNDVHPRLEAALAACGYAGWSANGTLAGGGGLPRADVHLDLLRWRGGARFRGAGKFLQALTAELRRRRKARLWDAPIGLLTHHLAHDEAAWGFLERFLRWTTRQAEVRWVALPDLLRRAAATTASPAGPEAVLSGLMSH